MCVCMSTGPVTSLCLANSKVFSMHTQKYSISLVPRSFEGSLPVIGAAILTRSLHDWLTILHCCQLALHDSHGCLVNYYSWSLLQTKTVSLSGLWFPASPPRPPWSYTHTDAMKLKQVRLVTQQLTIWHTLITHIFINENRLIYTVLYILNILPFSLLL